jgi:NADH-quinone oxidoreductase subunit G
LAVVNPVFATVQALPRHGCGDQAGPLGDPASVDAALLQPAVPNYYQTNAINRASATMAECTRTYTAPLLQAAE